MSHIKSILKKVDKDIEQYGTHMAGNKETTPQDIETVKCLLEAKVFGMLAELLESPEKMGGMMKMVEKHMPNVLKSLTSMGSAGSSMGNMGHGNHMQMNAYDNNYDNAYGRRGMPVAGRNEYDGYGSVNFHPGDDPHMRRGVPGSGRRRHRNEYDNEYDDMYDEDGMNENRHRSRRTGRFVKDEADGGNRQDSGNTGQNNTTTVGPNNKIGFNA